MPWNLGLGTGAGGGERMLLCKRAALPADWRTNGATPTAGQATVIENMFVSQYNVEKKLPDWVAYVLQGGLDRSRAIRENDKFKPENNNNMGATKQEIANAFSRNCNCNAEPYHQGHLAPFAEFAHNAVAAGSTYSVFNVVPQFASSNTKGGDWALFELAIRNFLNDMPAGEKIHVVAGSYYGMDGDYALRNTELTIPTHMWKVFCDPSSRISWGVWTYNDEETKTNGYGFWLHSVRFIEERLALMYGSRSYELFPDARCNTAQDIGVTRAVLEAAGMALHYFPAGCNTISDPSIVCQPKPASGTVVYWDKSGKCL
ncbi:hypothetical protein BDZ88DRAFT_456435 [Geranomyces variabilis]|nr:hypothetical protein BDZ88DRAFT_456435 [Geranomyces variabilis]KAJ3131146.1 nuclease [Geranomyces variabilis]